MSLTLTISLLIPVRAQSPPAGGSIFLPTLHRSDLLQRRVSGGPFIIILITIYFFFCSTTTTTIIILEFVVFFPPSFNQKEWNWKVFFMCVCVCVSGSCWLIIKPAECWCSAGKWRTALDPARSELRSRGCVRSNPSSLSPPSRRLQTPP